MKKAAKKKKAAALTKLRQQELCEAIVNDPSLRKPHDSEQIDWQRVRRLRPDWARELRLDHPKAALQAYGVAGYYRKKVKSQQEREGAKGLPLGGEAGEPEMEVPRLCPRCGLNLAALVLAYNAALRSERHEKSGEGAETQAPRKIRSPKSENRRRSE
jgi:hypothetical protein